jgi:hypothetical protein
VNESRNMETLPLSFAVLLSYLYQAVREIPEPRQASNATRYKLGDVILGAFSVFFMQCESFLEHQRQMQSRRGKDNAQSLFGVETIPSSPQIRNVLDEVDAKGLFEVFFQVYAAVRRGGTLQPYQQWNGHLLVALDGTEYFKSQKIHCECCSSRTHKTGRVSYFHQAILPVIVSPTQAQVIALAPEFITPQDGHDQQDCEVAAAKRWISQYATRFPPQSVTLLGDDLYSHQPLCEHCVSHQMSFIFTCLSESHPALYDWLGYLDANGEVKTLETQHWNKRTKEIYRYRYVNQIPLRDTQPALLVNWCEVTLLRASDEKVLYSNAFVTVLCDDYLGWVREGNLTASRSGTSTTVVDLGNS